MPINIKQVLTDYFYFTRKDRIAILVMGGAILTAIFLPQIIRKPLPPKPTEEAEADWLSAMDKIVMKKNKEAAEKESEQPVANNYQYDQSSNSYFYRQKKELFYFDPNTITTDGWKRLGISDKTIATINKYLTKGGRFRQPEDLSKIYGLLRDDYRRIAPYIQIESADVRGADKETRFLAKEKSGGATIIFAQVEINQAAVEDWEQLPGIGQVLASRIIKFRDKLGGFYAVQQVAETFGLADSTFQKIKPYLELRNTSVKKININEASVEELKAHPYIGYKLAKPIVSYREQHGLFSATDELKKIMAIDEQTLRKIINYLTVL